MEAEKLSNYAKDKSKQSKNYPDKEAGEQVGKSAKIIPIQEPQAEVTSIFINGVEYRPIGEVEAYKSQLKKLIEDRMNNLSDPDGAEHYEFETYASVLKLIDQVNPPKV